MPWCLVNSGSGALRVRELAAAGLRWVLWEPSMVRWLDQMLAFPEATLLTSASPATAVRSVADAVPPVSPGLGWMDKWTSGRMD